MNPFFHAAGSAWTISATSYTGSFGTVPVLAMPGRFSDCIVPPQVAAQLDGVFNDKQPIRERDILDGLSHTMFVAERSMGVFAREASPRPTEGLYHGWWFSGNYADTLFVALEPPNSYQKGPRSTMSRGTAASEHSGGVHVLFGDGSVQWVSDSIDSWPLDGANPRGSTLNSDSSWSNLPSRGIWQNLATRAGNDRADF